MINTRAAGDSRFARTGKDGAIYNADGVLLATVDSFTANVTYNNAAYSVLGNAQELVEAMETQTMPVWDFQGVLKGRNSTEERMVYRECIPSGQVDLQNITVGDVIKRAWNFAVNRPPKLQNLLALG